MSDHNPPTQDATAYQQTMEEVSHFLDVPFRVAIHLGRRTMKVREILQLKPNSIVELPKSAGENVDIFVNDKLMACGEVLEMEGNAGVRLTDVIPEL